MALDFAKRKNCDESTAYNAMMAAIGGVSNAYEPPVVTKPDEREGGQSRKINSLQNYLFTAYKHSLFHEMKKTERLSAAVESLDNNAAITTDSAAQIEKKILLEEIVAQMDRETLTIYEGLILGYSFEEIAKKRGQKANALRSKFSKQVKRIAAELNCGPVRLTA